MLGLTAVLALITTLIGCPAPDQAYVPTKIYMFSAGLHTSDLGRRAGADALAEAAVAGAGLAGPVRYAHAFISANSFDCIANMPFIFDIPPNLPIYAPNGTTLIANNWGELLDNSMPDTLENLLPGIDSLVVPYWWTGSEAGGICTSFYNNCQAWTVANFAPEDLGMVGDVTATNSQWLKSGGYEGAVALYLIGIAY